MHAIGVRVCMWGGLPFQHPPLVAALVARRGRSLGIDAGEDLAVQAQDGQLAPVLQHLPHTHARDVAMHLLRREAVAQLLEGDRIRLRLRSRWAVDYSVERSSSDGIPAKCDWAPPGCRQIREDEAGPVSS